MSTSDDRLKKARIQQSKVIEMRIRVRNLKDQGYSNAAIADVMGINESTVRTFLKPKTEEQ